jgi:hypothetical protein
MALALAPGQGKGIEGVSISFWHHISEEFGREEKVYSRM